MPNSMAGMNAQGMPGMPGAQGMGQVGQPNSAGQGSGALAQNPNASSTDNLSTATILLETRQQGKGEGLYKDYLGVVPDENGIREECKKAAARV